MMRAGFAPAIDAWNRAGARERIALGAMAVALVACVVVLWVVIPLQDAVGRAREGLVRQRMLLAAARSDLTRDASFAHATVPARTGDAAAAIDRVLAQHGLVPLSAAHAGTDGRIEVVIPEAGFDALLRALDALSRDEGLRVVEATLHARIAPGSVRAELVLQRERATP